MSIPIDKKAVYSARYPKGTKLQLLEDIDDPYTPKKKGDIFIVDTIDDALQIHGRWVSGCSMALIIERDKFEIVG